ncbi:ParB/RepB/Spo0J family partition protein [Paracoccus versutus]|uniref:ParB family chromosome partitioning protein n=1 Tax=Paracoccus versutus TaxID=34007 RepID=A0A3D9XIN5_PARVE|nr:ParB/RepB/Spo0J family partition protein [Paracoccus versutus]REF66719.1 ParB family chromosome partitioning protein [Paracoccus versutus]WGR56440.1 DNA-binding protein [Paracoccus versutus]
MATAVQKITLASSRDIPFNKLALSQSNVRRVKAGISVEELAESIARRGLIQSLHVRPIIGDDGTETGMFEVPAGGRRFRALELLVRQKRLAKTAPVPCVVSEAGADILIDEVSLAENIERAPLHPLDQFRAFLALREKGMTEEAIAAAFFVDVKVVRQRLRLASVSPALHETYAEDGMTLEQLMAFTVTEDHARQEQVWEAIRDNWAQEPWQIRRMLTETTVPASDKRAAFVGIEAYEAAGGYILRDLFQQDEGGWLQDPVLLDRLVGEKLKAEAEAIAAEGWKWIEVAVSFPYGHDHGLRELVGTPVDLTEEEQAACEALREEYDQLEAEYAGDDDLPDEVDQRLGEIEEALAAFEDRPVIYDPAEIARAGVFICIDGDGSAMIERGFVRPEDEAPADPEGEDGDGAGGAVPDGAEPGSHQRAVITIGGEPSDPEEEDDETDAIKPLPERLVIELTAHRTLALCDALASNPRIAMTALLHKLVLDCFGPPVSGCALQARVHDVHLPVQSPELGDSPSAQAIDERHEAWKRDIPLGQDDDRLWDWLDQLDQASRHALLAHCVSFGVNALYERPNPYSGNGVSQQGLDRRMHEADRLAQATGLDLVEAGWKPTVGNYLGRVTKTRIIEAVREGAGDHAAELIGHLKKGDMAKEAERLLADSGWLPEPLRGPVDAEAKDDAFGQDDDGVALPAFLAGDDDDDDETASADDEATQTVAAE